MENKKRLSPEVIYEQVAYIGFRKYFHLGGMKATAELIELCGIDKDTYVLDVGCGTGKTACYLAKNYGCKVVGIDILERMIERANERARREHVEDRVEFRVADAQNLPFKDETFDRVIGEWITGLLEDKERATKEYFRVTKSGGYVCLNEATWIKTSPPKELAEYISQTFGIKGEIPTSDGWQGLLKDSGLRDIKVKTYQVNTLSNNWGDLKDLMRVFHKALYLYIKSPAFRKFIKETLSLPKNLLEYFGYGIYVGRK